MENVFVKKANKVNFVKKRLDHVISIQIIVELMELVLLVNVFAITLLLEINAILKLSPKINARELIKSGKMENVNVKLDSMVKLALLLILYVKMIPVKMEELVQSMVANVHYP